MAGANTDNYTVHYNSIAISNYFKALVSRDYVRIVALALNSRRASFYGMAQRLPQDELMADGVEMLKHSAIDVDEAVRECLQWLSLPSNRHWLLIFDNIDRDFHNEDDPQAYNVKVYFPDTDYGSILITSRLASPQRHGPGIKVGTVTQSRQERFWRIMLEVRLRVSL